MPRFSSPPPPTPPLRKIFIHVGRKQKGTCCDSNLSRSENVYIHFWIFLTQVSFLVCHFKTLTCLSERQIIQPRWFFLTQLRDVKFPHQSRTFAVFVKNEIKEKENRAKKQKHVCAQFCSAHFQTGFIGLEQGKLQSFPAQVPKCPSPSVPAVWEYESRSSGEINLVYELTDSFFYIYKSVECHPRFWNTQKVLLFGTFNFGSRGTAGLGRMKNTRAIF